MILTDLDPDQLPPLRSPLAKPRKSRVLLDTNIANYSYRSGDGSVFERLLQGLVTHQLTHWAGVDLTVTPVQTLELLGAGVPEIEIKVRATEGVWPSALFAAVLEEALVQFEGHSKLAPDRLMARAQDLRQHIPENGLALFDMWVTRPCGQPDFATKLAEVLAWDAACAWPYPRKIVPGIERYLASLMIRPGSAHLSRFRLAKRMWEIFYSHARDSVPGANDLVEAGRRAMKIKSRGDILDCDLIHRACFGDDDRDVLVLTCDRPEIVEHRIAIYKGMVENAAAMAVDVPNHLLPAVSAGAVACCEPNGTITDVFLVQAVPTSV